MISKVLNKTIDLATTPARKLIDTGRDAVSLARSLPAEVENLIYNIRLAHREAEQDFKQMMRQVESSFGRDIADMTENEREETAMMELAKAEQHLSAALFSLLKAFRLAVAEPSRIIEHDEIIKGRLGRRTG